MVLQCRHYRIARMWPRSWCSICLKTNAGVGFIQIPLLLPLLFTKIRAVVEPGNPDNISSATQFRRLGLEAHQHLASDDKSSPAVLTLRPPGTRLGSDEISDALVYLGLVGSKVWSIWKADFAIHLNITVFNQTLID